MKKLIYSMLALLCVALAFTFTSCDDDPSPANHPGDGSKDNPYNAVEAINAVINMTWTTNTEYDKTDDVYVKGKISRIANNGTFAESGVNGNASFYISEDGSTNNEFYCFRVLYIGGKKYASGQEDIKVGDKVIICGKLMNYRNNTPETVPNGAYLYSLNGATYDGPGSKEHPFTVVEALNTVKSLNWISKTDYEKTGNVYVEGKISRISDNGKFAESGSYSNATFYISDETERNEFYCFRINYFGNKAYKIGQTDIKIGDDVVVYGRLMNYWGNTPQTVQGEACLYSLNGAMDGGAGGGESSVSFYTNIEAQTLATATDGTYGSGFGTTTQGLNINYYKHTSVSNPVAPNANHVRIYKNSVLCIASTEGKKIKEIIIKCAPDAGTTTYCFDMTGLEGCANAVHDSDAKTITWTGSTKKVVLLANNGQVRMESLIVTFE